MNATLSKCQIAAPFSVASRAEGARAAVRPARPGHLEIIDDSALELEFIVPSRWMAWLKDGYRFQVKIDETGTYPPRSSAWAPGRSGQPVRQDHRRHRRPVPRSDRRHERSGAARTACLHARLAEITPIRISRRLHDALEPDPQLLWQTPPQSPGPAPLALEQRLVFDGAAGAEAVAQAVATIR
jgi:hypothetical protein